MNLIVARAFIIVIRSIEIAGMNAKTMVIAKVTDMTKHPSIKKREAISVKGTFLSYYFPIIKGITLL